MIADEAKPDGGMWLAWHGRLGRMAGDVERTTALLDEGDEGYWLPDERADA